MDSMDSMSEKLENFGLPVAGIIMDEITAR
jgi:hypothetical protein